MDNESFGGDKKLPMKTLLAKYERKFIDSNVSKFPRWIEGYHLTLMTIPLSAGVIVFGYLAKSNYAWLWLSSLMLVLQWFTDSFDGALGRLRDTGIAKWGFFMDHFLDFVFMSSVFIGYSFLLEGLSKEIVYLFIPVFGCFMVSSYLSFGATNEFKITYLWAGPTEIRIWFIILNCLIIKFGTGFIEKVLIYILVLSIVFLCIVVYRTQKYIWKIDMQDKSSPQDALRRNSQTKPGA
ncbi:MAG: CDP-alcohol phosphatidyltransferase family protein [Planctomycetota bacterium]|jgi:phosphatidylglycerophosphate synthase